MRTAGNAITAALLFDVTCIGVIAPVHAEPSDYLVTPIVEHGEREVDFMFETAKSRPHSEQRAPNRPLG